MRRRRRPSAESLLLLRSGRPSALLLLPLAPLQLLLLACAGSPASDGPALAEAAEAADSSVRNAARGEGVGPARVECFALAWDVAGRVFRPEGIDVDTLPGQIELLPAPPPPSLPDWTGEARPALRFSGREAAGAWRRVGDTLEVAWTAGPEWIRLRFPAEDRPRGWIAEVRAAAEAEGAPSSRGSVAMVATGCDEERMLRIRVRRVSADSLAGAVPDRWTLGADDARFDVVASESPLHPDTAGPVFSPEPVLRLADDSTRPGYTFNAVVGATVLASGALVIADGNAESVRWFDASGELVRTVEGGKDGIPAWQSIGGLLRLPGDSLAVPDLGMFGSITVLDSAGRFARRIELSRQPGARTTPAFHSWGRLSDGSWVRLAEESASRRQGHLRRTARVHRWLPDGSAAGTAVEFAGTDMLVSLEDDGSIRSRSIPDVGRRAAAAFGEDVIYVGNGDAYEIAGFPLEGRPRVIRRPGAAYPVTQEMREWLLDPDRDFDARPPALGPAFFSAARDTAALRGFLDRHGQTLPAYRDLKVDGRGRLWVAARTAYGYDVFDADGRWLGRSQPPIPPDWFVDDLAIGEELNGIAVYRVLDPDTAIGPHGEPAWRWTRFAACFDLRPDGDDPAPHRAADPPLPRRVNLLHTQLWPHFARFALEPSAPGYRAYWTARDWTDARLLWEGDGRRLSIQLPPDSGGPGHARWWTPSGPSARMPITAEKVTCGSP